MFTATESGAILRLLNATNAVLAAPKDEPLDRSVWVELEHGRNAVAACYSDYVDNFVAKLDKAKDEMTKAWACFEPEHRRSYGPIFEAAGVRPDDEEPIIDTTATEAEVVSINGQPVAGLLSAAPNLLTEGEGEPEPDPEKFYELDENGNAYEVDEPFERFDPPASPDPAPEDELGKRRRKKRAKTEPEAEQAEGETETAGTVA